MVCEGYHVEAPRDRTRVERDAIVFELRALEAVAEKVESEPVLATATLEAPRKLAFTAAAESSQPPSEGKRNIYERSRDVRNYVLACANGKARGALVPHRFFALTALPILNLITFCA